jgi:hypothetical protein
VAADVLAQADQLAAGVEQTGRVEPAGGSERGLGCAQPLRQRREQVAG